MFSQEIPNVSRIQPEGNLNVCTKFPSNPSNNCLNISAVDQLTDIAIPRVMMLAWLKSPFVHTKNIFEFIVDVHYCPTIQRMN